MSGDYLIKKLRLEIEKSQREIDLLKTKTADQIVDILKKVFQRIVDGNDFWILPLHDYFFHTFESDRKLLEETYTVDIVLEIKRFLMTQFCCKRKFKPNCRCIIVNYIFFVKYLSRQRVRFGEYENELTLNIVSYMANSNLFFADVAGSSASGYTIMPDNDDDDDVADDTEKEKEKEKMIITDLIRKKLSEKRFIDISGTPFCYTYVADKLHFTSYFDDVDIDDVTSLFEFVNDFMNKNPRRYSLNLISLQTTLGCSIYVRNSDYFIGEELNAASNIDSDTFKRFLDKRIHNGLIPKNLTSSQSLPPAKSVIESWIEYENDVVLKTMMLIAWKRDEGSLFHNSNLPKELVKCIFKNMGPRTIF